MCVYNNEEGLPKVLNNINKISYLFTSLKVLAFYDHSNDASLEILKNAKINENDQIEIIINNNPKNIVKTENICNARNELLKRVIEYSPEYFIMIDSNEYACVGDINSELLKEMLERSDEWDALSFDRTAGYYDYWALSFDPYIFSFQHFTIHPNQVIEKMCESFKEILTDYKTNRPNELIPVYSAFNGFSIYKTSKFSNCKYGIYILLNLFPIDILLKQLNLLNCSLKNSLFNDCEHRRFHLEGISKNNAKIRICTKSLFNKVENNKITRGPC